MRWSRPQLTCRDLTVLFAALCRLQGLAVRFVSGYQARSAGSGGERHMHAWPEVYLPGVGWRGFDPSHGTEVGEAHVAVAAQDISPPMGEGRAAVGSGSAGRHGSHRPLHHRRGTAPLGRAMESNPPPMSAFGTRHYAALLVAAVGTLVSMALPWPYSLLTSVGFTVLIVLQIRLLYKVEANQATSLIFRAVGWLALASLWLWLLTPAQQGNSGLPLLVMLTLFELQAYPRLVVRLSREKRVTGDVLMGALAGYVLLGLAASLVTALLESVQPGSFRGLLPGGTPESGAGSTMQEVRFIHVAYFAFVTISTLGFGDVVPITPLARLSTILFSLLGPFYLAVNIGVLIGRYIQQEQSGS